MWLIFILSALIIAFVAMAVFWVMFKIWLKIKKEQIKFEKENQK